MEGRGGGARYQSVELSLPASQPPAAVRYEASLHDTRCPPPAARAHAGGDPERDVEADQRWACAMLMFVNSLLGHVGRHGNCPHLAAVRILMPPEACLSIQVG